MPGEDPPRSYVVIGAGVLGASVAARLAEAGAGVTLLEQARPGRAATRSSFAWLNANDKEPRAYHELNHAGMRAWAERAASAAGHARLAARVRRLAGWGYPARLIGAAEAAELEPSLRLPPSLPGAAWFPSEGYLLTERLVNELVGLAVQHGATVLTGEPGRVTGLDAAGGVVRAVRTAAGQVIPADAVVCCAGRWVPGLAALAGAALAGAGLAGTGLAGTTGPVPLVPWAAPGAAAPGLVVQAGPVTAPGPARV